MASSRSPSTRTTRPPGKLPLSRALQAAGADSDAELIAAARALLALAGEAGSGRAKYVVQAWGNQGVQIGDNNSQDNTFGPG